MESYHEHVHVNVLGALSVQEVAQRDVAQQSRRVTRGELHEQLFHELNAFEGHAQRVAVLEAFRDRE